MCVFQVICLLYIMVILCCIKTSLDTGFVVTAFAPSHRRQRSLQDHGIGSCATLNHAHVLEKPKKSAGRRWRGVGAVFSSDNHANHNADDDHNNNSHDDSDELPFFLDELALQLLGARLKGLGALGKVVGAILQLAQGSTAHECFLDVLDHDLLDLVYLDTGCVDLVGIGFVPLVHKRAKEVNTILAVAVAFIELGKEVVDDTQFGFWRGVAQVHDVVFDETVVHIDFPAAQRMLEGIAARCSKLDVVDQKVEAVLTGPTAAALASMRNKTTRRQALSSGGPFNVPYTTRRTEAHRSHCVECRRTKYAPWGEALQNSLGLCVGNAHLQQRHLATILPHERQQESKSVQTKGQHLRTTTPSEAKTRLSSVGWERGGPPNNQDFASPLCEHAVRNEQQARCCQHAQTHTHTHTRARKLGSREERTLTALIVSCA